MTALAGALLAAVTIVQALHLAGLRAATRRTAARAEARGLTEALRCRLEQQRALYDLNSPAMERSLADLAAHDPALAWAALHESSGRRLAAAGPAEEIAPESFDRTAGAAPDELPLVQEGPENRLLALTRLQVGERELVLALALAPADEDLESAGLAFLIPAGLSAGLAASALLLLRGLAEAAAGRRKGPSPPAPPAKP